MWPSMTKLGLLHKVHHFTLLHIFPSVQAIQVCIIVLDSQLLFVMISTSSKVLLIMFRQYKLFKSERVIKFSMHISPIFSYWVSYILLYTIQWVGEGGYWWKPCTALLRSDLHRGFDMVVATRIFLHSYL